MGLRVKSHLSMVIHVSNPSTWEEEGQETEGNLGYTMRHCSNEKKSGGKASYPIIAGCVSVSPGSGTEVRGLLNVNTVKTVNSEVE